MKNAQANGPFEVSMRPEPISEIAENTGIGRMSLDKKYYGDLEAVSQGEMLMFRNAAQGSAGYAAMEKVNGILHGKKGGFVLQHSSTMTRETPHQSITVVPDSGTDELTGLHGSMVINVTDGAHSYQFDYTLPENA